MSEILEIFGKYKKDIEKLSSIRCEGCIKGSIVIKDCEVRKCALER